MQSSTLCVSYTHTHTSRGDVLPCDERMKRGVQLEQAHERLDFGG